MFSLADHHHSGVYDVNVHNPEFIVFCGPMFSSKTTKLLSALERFRYQRKNIVVFKPRIDNRYSASSVVSHSGWNTPATIVETGMDVLEHFQKLEAQPDVIAVDELFMIDGIAEVLVWLFRNLGTTVVVSTLDLSATAKPFTEVEKVLPWATHVEKCSAVCVVCGADAPYTHKKATDLEEIKVGGEDDYEPRCYRHHTLVDASRLTHVQLAGFSKLQ